TLLKSSSPSTIVLFELAKSALPPKSVGTVLAIALIIALDAFLVACSSTPASNVGSSASQSAGSSPFIASESSSAISGNAFSYFANSLRSEEHTSELQSRFDLVCRLLLEKKIDTIESDTVVCNHFDVFA